MGKKKLTADEIIQIVEDKGISVDSFGYGDFYSYIPEDFVGSEELEAMIKLKDDAWDLVQNHPVYNQNYQVREANVEFQELYNKYFEIPSYQKRREGEWLVSIGLGKIEEVEQYGGEGQGETWYSVKHFVDHDVYIQTDGFYSSYNGTDFYEGYGEEVVPEERMVTVYVSKKVD